MKKSGFQQFMEKGALFSLAASAVCLCCRLIFGGSVWVALTITFTTVLYHFAVRIAVGAVVDHITASGVIYNRAWFRQSRAESFVYRLLRVHRWKLKIPTYTPEKFSLKQNTPEQVVCNMCAAELIHEVNFLVSFLPVVLSIVIPFLNSTLIVFVLTSSAAALFDLVFVVIQRYNRPRMMKLIGSRKYSNNAMK